MFPNIDQNIWIASGNVVRDNVVRGSGRADLLLSAPAGDHNCVSGNDFRTSLPPAIQIIHGCGFDLNRLGGGDLSGAIQTLGLFIRASTGNYPRGDWRTAPAPPPEPRMPGDPSVPPGGCPIGTHCPAQGPLTLLAEPGTAVPGTVSVDGLGPIPTINLKRLEVTVLGVSIAAPTWWSLLLATYAYLLPLILYVAWVAVALWDIIRREGISTGGRVGWTAAVLLVPLLGPTLYFVAGRSPIPRSMRTMLVGGGLVAYILIAVLAIVIGSS